MAANDRAVFERQQKKKKKDCMGYEGQKGEEGKGMWPKRSVSLMR